MCNITYCYLWAQELAEFLPGGAQGPYGVPWTEPGLVTCKTSSLPHCSIALGPIGGILKTWTTEEFGILWVGPDAPVFILCSCLPSLYILCHWFFLLSPCTFDKLTRQQTFSEHLRGLNWQWPRENPYTVACHLCWPPFHALFGGANVLTFLAFLSFP